LPPDVTKSFVPPSVVAGQVVAMQITIKNPNEATELTHVATYDAFPNCIKPLFDKKSIVYTPAVATAP
jgi:hypothetical protein